MVSYNWIRVFPALIPCIHSQYSSSFERLQDASNFAFYWETTGRYVSRWGFSTSHVHTLYYWINFHTAQQRGMHGNVERALWPFLLQVYIHCLLPVPCFFSSLPCFHSPARELSMVFSMESTLVENYSPKKEKDCFSSEFCLLNPIINLTNIYWTPNMHLLSRTLRKPQSNRSSIIYRSSVHLRGLQFSLGICCSMALLLYLPG